MMYIHIVRKFLFILGLLISVKAFSQEYHFSLNRDMNTRLQRYIATDTSSSFHSSCQPYTMADVNKIVAVDSLFDEPLRDSKFNRSWVGRKLRKEHLFVVNKDDILLSIDPIFNFQIGNETNTDRNVYVNTRGVLVQANVQNKFFFYTGFRENQARYVSYVDSFIRKYEVVPGQGKVKFLKNESFDFSQSFGGIAYTLNRHFDFLFAHDKLFIGDGYRSLLLSDNSYNYPFFRINMTFWKFRYSVIYAVMRDLTSPHDPDIGFNKKYSTTHYLDLNIGKKNSLSVGIFETVIFKTAASRGYELAYLNPILFLRPVENSLDSPDNVLLGLNVKWNPYGKNIFYGQLMLDEFLLGEVRAGNGWWGNKQGFQLGYKTADVFKVQNLNFQTEFNFVRPFTFQHRSEEQSYTHYGQALAHPLGADFTELLTFVNYKYKRWFTEVKFQMAQLGRDTAGVNLGNDIFRDYDTRPADYGYSMYTGIKTDLTSVDVRLNYLVNPKTNMNISAGIILRNTSNSLGNSESQFIYFGFRTMLENFYFDF